MPKLVHPQTGAVHEVESAAGIQEYLEAGYQLAEGGGDVGLITPGGREVAVDADRLAEYTTLLPQASSIDPGDLVSRGRAAFEAQELESEYGGVGGNVRALAEGAASGLTLGGYDLLADWAGMDTEKYAEANPNFRLVGEGGAVAAASLASGGAAAGARGLVGKALAATPAGALSRGSMALGAKVGGTGLRGLAAGAALEGGAYAAAQTTSQVLIEDDPLTAEAAVAEVARNALFGAVAGGGTVGVLGGLGKIGNRIVRGLDDANPALNFRGKRGREMFDTVGKAINEADASIEESLVRIERSVGVTPKLTSHEANLFSKADSDLRVMAKDIDRTVQEFSKVSVRGPRGIAEFNEQLESMHGDLTQLLGRGYRSTPLGLELDEAGDRLFRALARNEPEAIVSALPSYIAKAKKVARGLKVDVSDDLKRMLAFEEQLKAPPVVGLSDEVEAAYSRFKLLRAQFEDSGGLAPDAVERLVIGATDAGARTTATQARRFMEATRDLADMVGFARPAQMDDWITATERSMADLRAARPDVDPTHAASLRSAQADFRASLGLELDKPLKGTDIIRLAETPVEDLAPKLRSMDRYFAQAKEFAGSTGDTQLAARMVSVENYIKDATSSALNKANMERMTKEAMGMLLGAEVLEYAGLEGPIDDILQLAALHRLLSGAGSRMKKGSKGLLFRMMTRAGSRAAPAAAKAAGVIPHGGVGSAMSGGVMAAGYSAGGWLHDAIRGQAGLSGLAAKTRSSIGSALEGAGKAAGGGAKAGALTVSWLSRSRFEFGAGSERPDLHETGGDRKGLRAAFKARSTELAKFAAAPHVAQKAIHEQVRPLRLVSEKLADRIEMQSMQIPQWLYEKMPKDPGNMMTLGVSRWEASEVDILEWAEYGKGALYPLETIAGAMEGDISPQAAESLRTLWPEHFAALQLEIWKRAPELAESLTYDQQTRLYILTDVPIDSSHDPDFRQFMLEHEAQRMAESEATMAQPSPSAGASNPSREAEAEASPAQKLSR